MTPSNLLARKTNIIKAHEKALRLPVNACTINGMMQLDIEELEHGFTIDDSGTLRFLADLLTRHLFLDMDFYGELPNLNHPADDAPPDQRTAWAASLRRFYRNAGCEVKLYVEKFHPSAG